MSEPKRIRLSLDISRKSDAVLDLLVGRCGLTKTDIVQRALSLYEIATAPGVDQVTVRRGEKTETLVLA